MSISNVLIIEKNRFKVLLTSTICDAILQLTPVKLTTTIMAIVIILNSD